MAGRSGNRQLATGNSSDTIRRTLADETDQQEVNHHRGRSQTQEEINHARNADIAALVATVSLRVLVVVRLDGAGRVVAGHGVELKFLYAKTAAPNAV